MSMDGRTCIITGSARGIGRGIAEYLGAEGANVVINYRSSEDAAQSAVDAIEDAGGSAVAAQADVTDREEVVHMREVCHEAFGPADVLVNNAGITADVQFTEMSREDWDRVMDVNLGGMFNCTQEFFDDIWNAHEGRLINISSVVGKQGNFGQANYAAAKSGMFGFTRTIALELAKGGSTANCVAPGFTRTDMLESVPDQVLERIVSGIPLERLAEVEDIAAVVRFLASEDSSYVTGEVIDVNGGMDL
ncbi:short-chain dehydrogenase/reductase SDR [Haloterrigena turkmenica DSM 5511]|uniref:Short-chain dehydrogenase/reductase SDR n=1 Tax=Haloterrigena turkmenica (strain ATCC 51198 / DSM 5511 / JCM 9101 / NCIMB 13204 / VKM B-1734 / 4k) TaxID=543526 RepID=D2RVD1_HALTV|nr:beta-ketoacyl-ACP reductase [Haloterrigena turkmenica]ADB61332.1 short-chain dehydrogenase/reductase SDR [Haloterrigena turkmenica DSM 5511]